MSTEAIPFWLVEQCERLRSSDNDIVTNLCLNLRRLDANMLHHLIKAIMDNNTLNVLNLTNALTNCPQNVNLLSVLIKSNHSTLQTLHLSYNKLHDISHLAASVAFNSNLKSLHLDHNNIGDADAVILATAIQDSTGLQELGLSYNQISDKGCRALAYALRNNKSLKILNLVKNQITQDGVTDLCAALETRNTTLVSLPLNLTAAICEGTWAYMQLLCYANSKGRTLMYDDMSVSFWPHMLGNISSYQSLMYYFIKSRPDLLRGE